jgi:hypothetical protein
LNISDSKVIKVSNRKAKAVFRKEPHSLISLCGKNTGSGRRMQYNHHTKMAAIM